jgi:hypothetical protein
MQPTVASLTVWVTLPLNGYVPPTAKRQRAANCDVSAADMHGAAAQCPLMASTAAAMHTIIVPAWVSNP